MQQVAITLLEYNRRINRLMQQAEVQRCWIVAETSDVMVRGGHCYLELVQKDPATNRTIAKTRAIIWANRFAELRYRFEKETGQAFGNGLNVMVNVSANFHEQFGFSLLINEINPSYTLGDMARLRLEILARLKKEGIIDMNKELEIPILVQRIAVISTPAAAGYGDFINQLEHNSSGIKFYPCLFEAMMQGEKTVPTVIAALERIYEHIDLFDCVVIIRGGGSTSDLNSFDNYDLAANVAQFPLPVVCGIGHDRDNTVLDSIAAVRVKTPTAAAEWLVERAEQALLRVKQMRDEVVGTANQLLTDARRQLDFNTSSIPLLAENVVVRHRSRLNKFAAYIPSTALGRVASMIKTLDHYGDKVATSSRQRIAAENQRLAALAKQVELLSPERVLKRGYSLTMKGGKAVTDASLLKEGDVITTLLANGNINSVIK